MRIRKPAQPWNAKHNETTQTTATLTCKTQWEYADQRNPELQNTIGIRRLAQPWIAKHNTTTQTTATLNCKTHCNCDIQRFISWALKRPAQCAEQFLELKICVSLQFRASDTPIPVRGFIHQNTNVRRTTAPCIPKCANPSAIARSASRNEKTKVLLQFWAIDTTFLTRGLPASKWNLRFATVLGDRHHVFDERVVRRQNEICISLQFWPIDTTFLARGLPESKQNLRLATVLGDRHHVFSERVESEQMKFAFRYSFGRSTTRF